MSYPITNSHEVRQFAGNGMVTQGPASEGDANRNHLLMLRGNLRVCWEAGRAVPSAELGPAGPVLSRVYSFEHGLSGALHTHYINWSSFEIHHFQRDTRHWRFRFQDFKCQASKMRCGDTASGRRWL